MDSYLGSIQHIFFMRKFSSINSFLISIYFWLSNMGSNTHIRIVSRVIIAIMLTILVFSSFSVVYLTDDVMIDAGLKAVANEAVANEAVANEDTFKEKNISVLDKKSKFLVVGIIIGIFLLVVLSGSSGAINTNVEPTSFILIDYTVYPN